MNAAILVVSGLSLVCSASSLIIMIQVSRKAKDAESQVRQEIKAFKEKTDRNLSRVQTALNELEL